MIRHIVMFKLHDKADLAEGLAQLRSMEGKIPSLRSLEAGANVVDSARAYDLVIHTTFDDLDGLGDYAVHPAHRPVIEWAQAHCSSIVAIDYEY